MEKKPRAIFDVECYPNYFLICFRTIADDRRKHFELYDGHPLDTAGIVRILRSFTLVGFNSNIYDVPMLRYALRMGVTNAMLKKMSDAIVLRNLKPWEAEREFNLPDLPSWFDHIDLIEPAPSVQVGLKLYGARLNSKRIQDLPIEPDELIGPSDRPVIVSYCYNDLDNTLDLYRHIEPQIELRCQMSEQYGVDVRSKSDAQIAESVIRHELERITGEKLYRPELPHDYTFKYKPPSFISFKTEQMRDALKVVTDATFRLKKKEIRSSDDSDDDAINVGGIKVKISGIEMPAEIVGRKKKIDKATKKVIQEKVDPLLIHMGGSTYKMGVGGLHSTEEKISHYANDDVILRDADVASYYPAILLNCQLYPEHLGPAFLDVYRSIRERRISAKRAKDKVTDLTLKIVLNGTFGKLGSKWSFLYAPNLMIQVTITGQLALLMLIEELELAGISVISANTDGIVSRIPRRLEKTYHEIVKDWEQRTNFEMEFADYSALYSMSVNSYIAVKTDGSVKQKGLFAFVGSKGSPAEKNPMNYVCIDAVINYLTNGTPLEDTIEWCPDVRRFLTVRRVTGGASFDGKYLGKTVRWYHAKGSDSNIQYAKGDKLGHKVSKSDGGKPLMELDGMLPNDIDYAHYRDEAVKMLGDLGVL